jgi:hypothetical protein
MRALIATAAAALLTLSACNAPQAKMKTRIAPSSATAAMKRMIELGSSPR